MKCEIIAIGNEIVSGHTINSNASFLARELESLGIEVICHTSIKDVFSEIHQALDSALERRDLIITTGGLGPTPDDLTHEAIAKYFNVKLVQDPKVLKEIKNKFKQRGILNMPKINIKQAYKPKAAKWIPNKLGSANGIMLKTTRSSMILTFPGVPSELKHMWFNTVKRHLAGFSKEHIHSLTLKFSGIRESILAQKINNILKMKYPILGIYPDLDEIKIRITAKEKTLKRAKEITNKVAKQILKRTKKYYFGKDNDTLETLVAENLIKTRRRVATAESCTGGLLAKRLTDISGSSKYFNSSVVSYSNEAKINILGIKRELIKKHGAVSREVAREMAKGIKKITGSNIGISITGIAGPTGGSKEKPVGLVYFGFAQKNKVITKKVLFGSNRTRNEIRFLATQFALNWLRKEL